MPRRGIRRRNVGIVGASGAARGRRWTRNENARFRGRPVMAKSDIASVGEFDLQVLLAEVERRRLRLAAIRVLRTQLPFATGIVGARVPLGGDRRAGLDRVARERAPRLPVFRDLDRRDRLARVVRDVAAVGLRERRQRGEYGRDGIDAVVPTAAITQPPDQGRL